MNRPVMLSRSPRHGRLGRVGFTLIEILIATVLMIILMYAVAVIFGSVSESIGQSRATLEMTSRLRTTAARMKEDLEGTTVTTLPPARVDSNQGYLEYIEGPIGPVVDPWAVAQNTADEGGPYADTTVGDIDDILMFTTRSKGEPFTGLAGGVVVQSQEAEIVWFVRGRTLYRRVLLVRPDITDLDPGNIGYIATVSGFYIDNDLSVRKDWQADGTQILVSNSLGDLTKPECRYAHDPDPMVWNLASPRPPHPHTLQPWLGQVAGGSWYPGLGLPILAECSADTSVIPPAPNDWPAGNALPVLPLTATSPFDAWANPHPWPEVDPDTGAHSVYYDPTVPDAKNRIGEDVILTNVIGFDVKAWDPNAPLLTDDNGTVADLTDDTALQPGDPGYVAGLINSLPVVSYGAFADLNYMCRLGDAGGDGLPDYNVAGAPTPLFYHAGHVRSQLQGTLPLLVPVNYLPSIYDTWSFHYEHNQRWVDFNGNGVVDANETVGDEDNDTLFDEGTNGFDDDNNGIVDDIDERETMPPYPTALSGIQIKIRTFEPDSRQVREVTIVHEFLPK